MRINTKKYEPIIKQVFVDDRENKRIDFAMEQYAPFNPTKSHLDVGDYIFIGNNGTKVAFEYKTGDDFLSSVVNETHHLHNQIYDMITNYDYCFTIVQTEDLRGDLQRRYYQTGQDISFQQINGAIAEFNTVSTVLMTQSIYQAFDLMMRSAGKIINDKPYLYKFGKKTPNFALNSLSAMKGVEKRAETIVKTLNLHTLDDLMNLTKEDLVKVELVGGKTADIILNNIKRGRSNEIQKQN